MIHVQDRADALRTRDANVRTLHGPTSCRHDTPVAPVVGQVEVRDPAATRHASCKDGWPIALAVGESDRYKRARELRGRSRASTVPYPCRPCRATCCTYDARIARSGVESADGWPISSEVGKPDDPRTRSRRHIAYERRQRPDTSRVNKLPHDTPVAPVVGQVEVRDLPQRHASCKDGWPIALAVGESDRYKRARELRGRSRASTVPYPCRPCRATCCTYDACVARSGVESNGRVAHRSSGWVTPPL